MKKAKLKIDTLASHTDDTGWLAQKRRGMKRNDEKRNEEKR